MRDGEVGVLYNCVSENMNALPSNSESTVHKTASPSIGKCKDDLSYAILKFSLVLTQYSFNNRTILWTSYPLHWRNFPGRTLKSAITSR
jgi:hypothetical protein